MLLKLYLIIITNAGNANLSNLQDILNVKNQYQQEISLAEAQNRHGVGIGRYDDKIIITSDELVSIFLKKVRQIVKNNSAPYFLAAIL